MPISTLGVRAASGRGLALLALLLCFVGSCTESADAPDPAPPGPLIPLRTLFSSGSFDAARVSPDGELVAFVGDLDGAANLFVAPVDDPASARPLTHERGRGLQARDVSGNVMYRWSVDSRHVLFPQDNDGDENWNLWSADVASGALRNLTQLETGRVELRGLSQSRPTEALIGISGSLLQPADLYHLDLDTGQRTLVEPAGDFIGFLSDNDLQPRLALRLNGEGGIDLLRKDEDRGWVAAFVVGPDDVPALSATGNQKIAGFDEGNRTAYFYDSRGRDTIALVGYRLEEDELEIVAEDAKVDIGGVLYHPRSGLPQAYVTNWTRMQWHALDPSVAADLEWLDAQTDGDVRVENRSLDDRRWIVRFTLAHEPESYWIYTRDPENADERSLQKLFVTTPELEGLELSRMYPIVVRSRDGLDLVSYLSFPPWLDAGNGRPVEPVPLVLLVHGGPSDERAQYAYGPFVHWLANRGYGVLYANFRGSPGFGKTFMNAQRMEWGGKMHDDLIDQIEWAIAEGVTEAGRVAIVGGSYGGYAVLVGMTMTPEVFACGVDLVGPSNLEIFMPHWNVDTMSKIVGDPRTEEGRAHLRSRSPIHFADRARGALLIGQGANDSRVPQEQSDQMVEVLERSGVPVTYMLYPDEGHGLLRQENNTAFWAVSEVFLGQCLGGRSRALTDELEGSSVTVPVGAEHVPGLQEALARRRAGESSPARGG